MAVQKIFIRRVLILLAGLLLSGCGFPAPAGTPAPGSPTLPDHLTTAQASAPAAATLPRLPTLTPSAIPEPAAGAGAYFHLSPPDEAASYRLTAWTPAEAHDLLVEMSTAYERLWAERSTALEEVPRATSILLYTLQQALFFFPEAPQAESWRWQQAFIRARTGDADAAEAFRVLTQNGLESGIQPADLAAWMVRMEPRLQEGQITLAEVEGQADSRLLTIQIAGLPAYYWIAQDMVYLLTTGWEFREPPEQSMRLEWHDSTLDGQPEAWLVRVDGSQRWDMASLEVYELAKDEEGKRELRHIEFSPALPAMQDGAWQAVADIDGSPGLQVRLRLDGGEALCEYQPLLTYRALGPSFQWVGFEQLSLEGIMTAGLSEPQARLCLDLTVDWLRRQARAYEPLAQQAVQSLLEGFPYGSDSILYLGLYPPDEADRARFELALSLAWSGDGTGATRWMSAVAERPVLPDGPWASPARAFVEAYREGHDLRLACLASQSCLGRSRFSLRQLVERMTTDDLEDPAAFFRQAGLPILLDGTQDLDGDGTKETWWVEDSGQAADVLWVAARQENGLSLGSLEISAGAHVLTFTQLEPLRQDTVWELDSGLERLHVIFRRSASGQLILRSLAQQRRHLLQEQWQALYAGAAPDEVLQAAADLQVTPYFDCAAPTELCHPEESLVLLLALVHERNGDLEAAAGYALQLWQDFPSSPAAWLAQKRLQD